MGPIWTTHIHGLIFRLLIPWVVLDKLVENDGHQGKDDYIVPSISRQTNKGNQHNSGSFALRVL